MIDFLSWHVSSLLYSFSLSFWVDICLCKFGKCLRVDLYFKSCLGFIAISSISWSNLWTSFLTDLHFWQNPILSLSFLILLWCVWYFCAQTYWVTFPSSLSIIRKIWSQLEQILSRDTTAPRMALPHPSTVGFWSALTLISKGFPFGTFF